MALRSIALRLAPLAALPAVLMAHGAPVGTCADFETGTLPSFISAKFTSSPPANGRVQVTTAFPFNGLWALDLDTDCAGCGGNTLQSAILTADLAGESHPQLRFWVHEHGDENHPEDGVFISDDGGATFFQMLSLNGFPTSYVMIGMDLEDAATASGMNLVDGFLIKFQSFDDFSIASGDGYSFDDICLLASSIFADSFESGSVP